MNWWEFAILIFCLIIIIASAILSLIVSNKLTRLRAYPSDSKLQKSQIWYNWASVIGWLTAVALSIYLAVFLVQQSYSSTHQYNYTSRGFTRFGLWLVMAFAAVTLIFTLVAFSELKSSANYGSAEQSNIDTFSLISLFFIIGATLIILILLILTLFRKPQLHKSYKLSRDCSGERVVTFKMEV